MAPCGQASHIGDHTSTNSRHFEQLKLLFEQFNLIVIEMLSEDNSIYTETLSIPAYECDANLRWKPAAFLQHMTAAANNHIDRLGEGYEALLKRGVVWVLSRIKFQFLRFPRVEEQITICTWPKTIQQKLFFIRDYEILSASGEVIAAATSAWLMMNMQTRRLVPPSSLQLNLPQNPNRQGLAEPLEKLIMPEESEQKMRIRAAYSAIDVVGHVNNARYLEWICDAFPTEWYAQHQLDTLQINYDREIHPEDEVSIRMAPLDGQPSFYMLSGENLTQGTQAFIAALRWNDLNSKISSFTVEIS